MCCFSRWLVACLIAISSVACTSPGTHLAWDQRTPLEMSPTQERSQRRVVLASAYFEQGQTDVALQEVRAALKMDAHNPHAYNLLGLIHQNNDALHLAKQSFERSIQLAQDAGDDAAMANAQHNLGWLWCQQGQFERAQSQFELALSQMHYRGHGKTWMMSGMCHARAGNTPAAQASWMRSLERDPRNPWVRYQLALLAWPTQPKQAQTLLAPLHDSGLATPESLWLGVRAANAMGQTEQMQQLGQQLQQRFPTSEQTQAWIQRKFEQQ